jgi:hypothetical protein
MNPFDMKWKACVACAKKVTNQRETAPFGFTTRVLSAVAAHRSSEMASLEVVWQRLTLRSLRWIGALLVLCVILEVPHLRDRGPLEPDIEDTVAQLVWRL